VVADGFQRPTIDHRARLRLQRVPEVMDEIEKASAAGLLPANLVEVLLDRRSLVLLGGPRTAITAAMQGRLKASRSPSKTNYSGCRLI
jgi:hypothetical protein